MDKAKTIYQFVTIDEKSKFQILEFPYTGIPFQITGVDTRKSIRTQLQMQPRFHAFLGPMWGGYNDNGQPIIRYESTQAYNELSQ
ncbi:hypothetical protein [Bacillus pseudomycoides]|uniref:hypothetical protein n=1 Tax=Bacillus pseudomycoides TaxID=64104 RepID=UPI0005005B42|nr:hypothetical protein [Bacillus pseudomycoides]KFN13784.1 hypothetical protein DJ94_4505 [Bacillus pseudomycoides]MDR4188010.1 hypothetical protein [Bacillus pseudomycoides]MED0856363.1 hypothetical protein [Bacillus pseudomycoides]